MKVKVVECIMYENRILKYCGLLFVLYIDFFWKCVYVFILVLVMMIMMMMVV